MRTLLHFALASFALPLLAGALGACGAAPPLQVVILMAPPVAPVAESHEAVDPPPGFGRAARIASGFQGRIYALPEGTGHLPDFAEMDPLGSIYTTALDVTPRPFDKGFPGVTDRFEWFGIDYRGTFTVAAAGRYRFRITADDGAKLFIDGETVLEDDGIHPPTTVEGAVHLSRGQHDIHVPYFQGPRVEIALVLEVAPPGEAYGIFRIDRPLEGRVAVGALD